MSIGGYNRGLDDSCAGEPINNKLALKDPDYMAGYSMGPGEPDWDAEAAYVRKLEADYTKHCEEQYARYIEEQRVRAQLIEIEADGLMDTRRGCVCNIDSIMHRSGSGWTDCGDKCVASRFNSGLNRWEIAEEEEADGF